MKSHTAKFFEATDLIPKSWDSNFWTAFSTNAPFSWGDNNRTLVTASSFRLHAMDALDIDEPDYESGETDMVFCEAMGEEIDYQVYLNFIDMLHKMGETYIDLEN